MIIPLSKFVICDQMNTRNPKTHPHPPKNLFKPLKGVGGLNSLHVMTYDASYVIKSVMDIAGLQYGHYVLSFHVHSNNSLCSAMTYVRYFDH